MTDTTKHHSTRDPALPPLELPLTGQLFSGTNLSVSVHQVTPGVCLRHSHVQAQLCLACAPAAGLVRRFPSAHDVDELTIPGRTVTCVAPNMPHDCRWNHSGEVIGIYPESIFLEKYPRDQIAPLFQREALPECANDAVIWQAALVISLLASEPQPDGNLIVKVGELVAERIIARHARPAGWTGPRLSDAKRKKLDAFLQENFGRKIRAPELAKAVHFSPSHFATLLRNATGKTPMEYLKEFRLAQAHDMMLHTDRNLKRIAPLCGFFDDSHLSREFKRFYHYLPSVLLKHRRP